MPQTSDLANGTHGHAGGGCVIPPRQQPYTQAIELALAALRARELTEVRLDALGCVRAADGCLELPLLDRRVRVDLTAGEVRSEHGTPLKQMWAVLVLHYLCADDTALDEDEVSLGHFSECRGYISVFRNRIIARFLATVGRSAENFRQQSERLQAVPLLGPGLGYRFQVLPRIPITIIRHEDDGELGPDANVIYRRDIGRLLPPEDRIVAVELLLDTLGGKALEAG